MGTVNLLCCKSVKSFHPSSPIPGIEVTLKGIGRDGTVRHVAGSGSSELDALKMAFVELVGNKDLPLELRCNQVRNLESEDEELLFQVFATLNGEFNLVGKGLAKDLLPAAFLALCDLGF